MKNHIKSDFEIDAKQQVIVKGIILPLQSTTLLIHSVNIINVIGDNANTNSQYYPRQLKRRQTLFFKFFKYFSGYKNNAHL